MAQPSNTHDSYDAIGIREDLADVIYNIAPSDTPFMMMIKKGKATQRVHEWQTDTLAAAGANAKIEGDDATNVAVTPTVRLNNQTQISDKVVQVSGSVESMDKAGRGREMAYEMVKKAKELKLDMERAMIGVNQAKVAGNATTARQLASVESWINTNTSAGATGADPTGDGTNGRTDGTQRAFTEALLQAVLEAAYLSGGDPSVIMVRPFNKRAISGFNGNADQVQHVNDDKKVINSVEIYVGDYHTLKVVPSRLVRDRSALVLDPTMWATAFLRPFFQQDLAKTGDSFRKQLLVEYTLEARNEASSGIVADLTTS